MFEHTDKQQLLTLYIQCDSTINRKTFIASCKETVQLAHSRNTPYIYLHAVFYT